MPVRIIGESPDGYATVQYLDGTTAELPYDQAVDEVKRSYPEEGGQGPVPGNAYDPGSEQNPYTWTPEEAIRMEQAPPGAPPSAPEVNPGGPPMNVGVTQGPVPPIPHQEQPQITRSPAPTGYGPGITDAPPEVAPMPAEDNLRAVRYDRPLEQPQLARYTSPVANRRITPHGDYGQPRSGGRTHEGLDFGGNRGDPVMAVLPGHVTRVGPTVGDEGRGGNRVEVDHGKGLASSYMHLDGFNVEEGSDVVAGQPIATMGTSGTSASGPHLHWKGTYKGVPINEEEFKRIAVEQGIAAPDDGSPGATTSSQASPGGVGAGGGALLPGTTSQSGSYSGQSPGATPPITDPSQVPNVGLPEVPASDRYSADLGQIKSLGLEAAGLERDAGLGSDQAAIRAQQAQQTQLAREQAMHADASAHADQERARYEANIQEAMKQVRSVDPGRAWKNAGALGSAAGIFSAGVGGWLQVLHGGPNHALDAINQVIQNDLRAQETDIATQREGVYRAERAGERSERAIGDRFRRLEEGKLLRLQSLMSAADAEQLKFKSPIREANYLKTKAVLEEEMLKTMKGLSDEEYDRAFKTRTGQWNIASDLETARARREQIGVSWADLDVRKATASAKGTDGAELTYINDPNTPGRAWVVDPRVARTMDKGEYGKVRESLPKDADALAQAKRYVARLQELGRTYQGPGRGTKFSPTGEQLAELRQLREVAIKAIRHAEAGANLTGFELPIWQAVFPEPTSTISQVATDDAARFVELHGQKVQRLYANTYGLRDMDPKTGELTPVDLTKEWGTVNTGGDDPVDASGLRSRMNESVKAIEKLTPFRGPGAGNASPRDPSHAERAAGVSNVPPGEASKSPKLDVTVRSALLDAHKLAKWVTKYPDKVGASWDLVEGSIEDMKRNSAVLNASGYEDEGMELWLIAEDLKEHLTKEAHKEKFRRDQAENTGRDWSERK